MSEDGGAYRKVVDLLDNHTILYSSLLDYNTNYRVKVVAYKWVNGKQVYGKESTSVAFKTERRSTTEGNSSVPRVTGLRANVVGDTVYLSWTPVSGAVKYEIDFTVPGIGGNVKMTEYSTSRTISGLTDKKYNYSFLDIYSNSLNIFLELSKELNLYFNNESTINSLLLKINK